MVDYNGLENRRTERYRGFESLSLRNPSNQKSLVHYGLATFFLVPASAKFVFKRFLHYSNFSNCSTAWVISS